MHSVRDIRMNKLIKGGQKSLSKMNRMGTYTLTNVTAAFCYSLFARLQRLTRDSNRHGTTMAASSVELTAFNAGWHVSFVSWRGILRIEIGIEDTVTK